MTDGLSDLQFPWKLHVVLAHAERNGHSHVISWLPDGDAFMVHDKVEFANVLMPEYFDSKKYKSFQRNLNLWGFRTLTRNPNKGAIFHPDFLRSNPLQCKLIKRTRIKKKLPRMSLADFLASIQDTTTIPHSPSSPLLSPDSKTSPMVYRVNGAMKAHPLEDKQVLAHWQNVRQNLQAPLVSTTAGTSSDHHQLHTSPSRIRCESYSHGTSTSSPTTHALPSLAWNCLTLGQPAQKQASHQHLMPTVAGTTLDLHSIQMQLRLALLEAQNTSSDKPQGVNVGRA